MYTTMNRAQRAQQHALPSQEQRAGARSHASHVACIHLDMASIRQPSDKQPSNMSTTITITITTPYAASPALQHLGTSLPCFALLCFALLCFAVSPTMYNTCTLVIAAPTATVLY
ncbi:hypothetical protein K504DRAFT_122747 [Pleomassaria siparia CBS 279.74]|uniref:Uncharacterized protein n=1 Tax=Pleomassaria siparia CBS 279.74 TaxID=1314801 RepID=A0A6G1KJ47_9PLEO|nr:hypothetical protein K504DRAFT_122747 [Pleomassaria siparia CBS 279.74]